MTSRARRVVTRRTRRTKTVDEELLIRALVLIAEESGRQDRDRKQQ